MNEKGFVKSLKNSAKKIDKNAFTWKTADRVHAGVPDLWVIIRGQLIILEVKARPFMWSMGILEKSTSFLTHPFSGVQVGTLRQLARAGAHAMGAIQISTNEALLVHPENIPGNGNFRMDEVMSSTVLVEKVNHIWRIDQWPSLLYNL